MPHWRRCMQGHAGSNLLPVAAANRIGLECVEPNTENGGQSSSLLFYGSFDLDEVAENRMSWGLFRDRRPHCYSKITE